MSESLEFIDQVYDDIPSVASRKQGERLVPIISRIGQELAEIGGQIEVSKIQQRYSPVVGSEAVMIALRQASQENKLDLDEVDGIVYPPRRQSAAQQRYRYM